MLILAPPIPSAHKSHTTLEIVVLAMRMLPKIKVAVIARNAHRRAVVITVKRVEVFFVCYLKVATAAEWAGEQLRVAITPILQFEHLFSGVFDFRNSPNQACAIAISPQRRRAPIAPMPASPISQPYSRVVHILRQ
jgi:hypothetical protein